MGSALIRHSYVVDTFSSVAVDAPVGSLGKSLILNSKSKIEPFFHRYYEKIVEFSPIDSRI